MAAADLTQVGRARPNANRGCGRDESRGEADGRTGQAGARGRVSQRTPLIAALVAACAAHARLVALIGLVLALGCAGYAATHFAMSTNTDELISHKLPWRARNAAFDAVFP